MENARRYSKDRSPASGQFELGAIRQQFLTKCAGWSEIDLDAAPVLRNRNMIFPLSGIIIGAILGVFRAKRRGGIFLDLLQWGVVNAIIFGVIGMLVLVIIERAAM